MDDTGVLRLNPEERTRILASRLTVYIKRKTDLEAGPQNILDDVSLDVRPGELLAIMGGSGSGKTTLLNTLSQRLNIHNKLLRFSGTIEYIDGLQKAAKTVRNAYLQQTDVFLPGLTVWETLSFQADLRLPRGTERLQKTELIALLLQVLELENQRNDVIVPFSGSVSLSGGEQRRVSLAIQLLSKPQVLFLDEPTTGLDTTSSLKMVAVLKKLASKEYGVTVILSIHQPRREITAMFDKVCLLTRGGKTIYYGSVAESEAYFANVFRNGFGGAFEERWSNGEKINNAIKDESFEEKDKEEFSNKVPNKRPNKGPNEWYLCTNRDDDYSEKNHEHPAHSKADLLGETDIGDGLVKGHLNQQREEPSPQYELPDQTYLKQWLNHSLSENDFHELHTPSPPSSRSILDHIMDLLVKDCTTHEQEVATSQKIDLLVSHWQKTADTKPLELSEEEMNTKFRRNLASFQRPRREKISLWTEISILTRRTFILSYRDTQSLSAIIGGCFFLSVACGWIFYKPHPDISGIRSLTSSLYVMLEVMGFIPVFLEVERLWKADGVFFFREYKEDYVSIPGFIISRRLGKLFLEDMPISVIFAAITYYMWGLRNTDIYGSGPTDGRFFAAYLAITILTTYMGMATAFAAFAITPDLPLSMLVVNCFYQLQNSASGFLVNASTMPVYVKWIRYVCYFWYAFGAMCSNQFTMWMGACPNPDIFSEECVEYSGQYQLLKLGFPQYWLAVPVCALVGYMAVLYGITALGLYLRNYDLKVAKTRENTIGKEELDESTEMTVFKKTSLFLEDMPKANVDLFDISIEHVGLKVRVKDPDAKFFGMKKTDKTLLLGVGAFFLGGQVNAIMGPSGSGKTSLLSFLGGRLLKTFHFSSSGTIKVNSAEICSQKLAQVAAFVAQQDHSLIPTLTVRETLFYQAKLRVPVEDHHLIPSIINKLIRQTGLFDCADTMIGSDTLKGISGGEKRRVSIATQLLSKPKILFLDEPTSGLDSATALSILTLLGDLAARDGTTVILTIHQPNEEIFAKLQTVLLLAKGGSVIFSGVASQINPFLFLAGLEKPPGANMADHLLDMVSKNGDETHDQVISRMALLQSKYELFKARLALPSERKTLLDITKWKKTKVPFWTVFLTISKRQFVNCIRSPDILFARAFQVVLLGITHTLFFAPLKNTAAGIDNRLGLVQEVLNLYFVGLINNISLFPIEREILFQEYRDGICGPFEFNLAYLTNEVPIELLSCGFFSILLVFGVGLPRNAAMFFGMFATCFISVNVGDSLGIIVNSVFRHTGMATNLLANVVTVGVFMGGTMSIQLPHFFQAWNYLSPLRYAVLICAKLGFRGQHFGCGEGAGECTLRTGEDVLQHYNLQSNLGASFGGLAACLVIYRALAILAVYVRVKWFV